MIIENPNVESTDEGSQIDDDVEPVVQQGTQNMAESQLVFVLHEFNFHLFFLHIISTHFFNNNIPTLTKLLEKIFLAYWDALLNTSKILKNPAIPSALFNCFLWSLEPPPPQLEIELSKEALQFLADYKYFK